MSTPVSDSSTLQATSLPDYHEIRTCTESYFSRLGDSALGMGWPNIPDAVRRYEVMLDVIPNRRLLETPVSVLDLGCGCGHLFEHLQQQQQSISQIDYTGIDLSERFIQRCLEKHPEADFRQMDILQTPELLESFDYIIINGIFTSRCSMSFEQMWSFVQAMLTLCFSRARGGLAFNAMSKQVDWEREDLFHLPLDTFASFCCRNLSRHFVIRNDYGLYEFAAYVYQKPQA
jgi:SAM-dependent methyltransferase